MRAAAVDVVRVARPAVRRRRDDRSDVTDGIYIPDRFSHIPDAAEIAATDLHSRSPPVRTRHGGARAVQDPDRVALGAQRGDHLSTYQTKSPGYQYTHSLLREGPPQQIKYERALVLLW